MTFLSKISLLFLRNLDCVKLWHINMKLKKLNNMMLPKNGSVVILDDKINQALPVIKALSKNGVSTSFYTGVKDDLPANPLQSIRLVIADLQLAEADNDQHTIATRLVHILKKIIAPNNGPYILLIWSLKKHLYGEEVKKEISKKENAIVPICIVELAKAKCIEKKIGNNDKLNDFRKSVLKELGNSPIEEENLQFVKESINRNWIIDEEAEYDIKANAIEIIKDNIEEQLKMAGVFHLFVIWENLLRRAGSKTVHDISTTIDTNDLWENNMRNVFNRLGQARIGKNNLDKELFLKEALTTLSGSFSEEIEYEIRKLKFPSYITLNASHSISGKLFEDKFSIDVFKDEKGKRVRLLKNGETYKGKDNIKLEKINVLAANLSEKEKPFVEDLIKKYLKIPDIINTKLHLEIEPSGSHIPGNVYKMDLSDAKKKEYLTSYLNNLPEDVSDYHFIELEVSPVCDYAQKKWKKSRLISGLIYPAENSSSKFGPFYKDSPDIIIDNKKYSLVFNYLLFKALDVTEVEQRGKPWFRIKREMFQDILAGLSGHVNRPGITSVD